MKDFSVKVAKRVAASLLLASTLTATGALAQPFPPFPEPAVGPFPDTENMTLLSQLVPDEVNAFTPWGGRVPE